MRESGREVWDLYDANGKSLGKTAYRGDSLKMGEYHLVIHVWVRRPDGNYLIQKRSQSLTIHPGMWAATGGSVIAGESSKEGAARELGEELGIEAEPKELRQFFARKKRNSLVSAWLLEREIAQSEIRLQEEEVSEVSWATPEHIRSMVAAGKFCEYGNEYFDTLFSFC